MNTLTNAKADLKPADFSLLAAFIDEYYEGNLLTLIKWVDRTIYMLHYLPEGDSFSEIQRQNTCFALFNLKECLMEVYFKQNEWYYAPFETRESE